MYTVISLTSLPVWRKTLVELCSLLIISWKLETLQFLELDNEMPIQSDYCTSLRQHLAPSDEQAGSLAERE